MKRLFALLLVLMSPALYGQVDFTDAVNVPNTVVNSNFENCTPGVNAPNCGGAGWGAWKEGPGFQPGDFTNAFGSTEYAFSYVNGTLYQDIALFNFNTNAFNFYFDFALNNSCRNSIGGYCENPNGPIDFISAKIYFYDENGLNNQFTFLNGNVSTAGTACVGGLELLGICLLGTELTSQWQQFGWYSSVQSDTIFQSARIEFSGYDVGFWGGLYGPRIDNVNLQINYLPPPYPTSGGGAGMNVSAPGSDYIFIFKGNDPVLFSQLSMLGQDLVGWTALCEACGNDLKITAVTKPDPDYLFLYTDGNPISGSWYSFQEQPPTVNCVTDPFNPECILTTLNIDDGIVDYTDPDEVAALTANNDSDTDTSTDTEDTTDEEVLEEMIAASAEDSIDESIDETDASSNDLEEMLAENDDEEEVVVEEEKVSATYRELSDEEKAAILADAISKNTLEGALSIAAAAESNAISQGAVGESTTASDTSTKNASAITVADITSETTLSSLSGSADVFVDNSKEDSSSSDSNNAGADILETGRQLGQAALVTTLAATAESAAESVNQAENIAATSSNESQSTIVATTDTVTTNTETLEQVTENANVEIEKSESVTNKEEVSEVLVANTEQQTETIQETIAETNVKSEETQTNETTETLVAESTVSQEEQMTPVSETKTEEIIVAEVQTETSEVVDETAEVMVADTTQTEQSAVTYSDVESAIEVFAANLPQQISAAAEQEELENTILQQSIASSQQQEETKDTFSEAEAVTIASDPALANAFNMAPNMMNLEVTGVLSQKQEEKSDAELRAEQVVAANKEDQDKINANYMEADQSGIVAAMGADTDVTSYRTAMLRDNNNWYKPEDIYKGVIIKDNARGAYFLEKGNTDTYKKMVEEQYK